MGKTSKHLLDAFAGESQANRKYLAYAKQADKEGHKEIAKLFRAAAAAETVHAHAHLRVAGGIGKTAENLKDAISGETHEFTSMYPEMIRDAQAEGEKDAVRSFTYANEVEKIHADLYQNALENIDAPESVDSYYVCGVCGYTVANEKPDKCPVCGSSAKAFEKID